MTEGDRCAAHARARHQERVVVPARKRVLEQALLQYNAMQVGIFQLLDAQRAQLDAELAAVEALREYWTAKAAFDALLAGRLVESGGAEAPAAMPRASGASAGSRSPTSKAHRQSIGTASSTIRLAAQRPSIAR